MLRVDDVPDVTDTDVPPVNELVAFLNQVMVMVAPDAVPQVLYVKTIGLAVAFWQ